MSCSSAARAAVLGLAPSSAASSEASRAHSTECAQHVLPVAGAVVQAPQQAGQLGMQRAHVGLVHRLLPHLDHVLVDLRPCLAVGLLDAGGMDAAVGEQLLQRQPRDLTAHAVEARQQHRSGRVVDDEVDPCEGLEGPDVAPLAADDVAFKLVGAQLDHGHRGLDRVAPGHPLHHRGQDAAGAALGVVLGLLLRLADHARRLVAHLVLQLAHEQLLGLARAEAGHALELAHLVAARLLELGPLVVNVALAVVQRLLPGVLGRLTRPQALLEPPQLGAPGRQLVLRRLPVSHGHRLDGEPRAGAVAVAAPRGTVSRGGATAAPPGLRRPACARGPWRARPPRTLPLPPTPPGRSPSNPLLRSGARAIAVSSSSVRLGAVGLRLLARACAHAPEGARARSSLSDRSTARRGPSGRMKAAICTGCTCQAARQSAIRAGGPGSGGQACRVGLRSTGRARSSGPASRGLTGAPLTDAFCRFLTEEAYAASRSRQRTAS